MLLMSKKMLKIISKLQPITRKRQNIILMPQSIMRRAIMKRPDKVPLLQMDIIYVRVNTRRKMPNITH